MPPQRATIRFQHQLGKTEDRPLQRRKSQAALKYNRRLDGADRS